ncbi:hypothetical protein GCM10009555_097460 [Acrocarpospora macrocephala]|uniref:Uncharacterized protein n=1 Tax=Acrocarpospora macrocephala TaxID=150177 RepID=A0A5M3WWR7_9ACTN|nr:hypothetical protein [Acrocarpospora macrocephala]GES12672.1 hypothetical protein Amac_062690 [Acrocarpospora macrocephala]
MTSAGRCSVYAHRKKIFVLPASQTKAGFYLETDPVEVLEAAAVGAAEVGASVARALALSKVGVPTPGRDDYGTPAVVTAAGLRSWSTFAKKAKHVSVQVSDGTLQIDRWVQEDGGFVEEDEDRQRVMDAKSVDHSELGAQILGLLED